MGECEDESDFYEDGPFVARVLYCGQPACTYKLYGLVVLTPRKLAEHTLNACCRGWIVMRALAKKRQDGSVEIKPTNHST
eukprot:m.15123 g.15123  ORF g.15123 m.15123 type:complete len:80 (-) comp5289_c0_seq1:1281-1520(-)